MKKRVLILLTVVVTSHNKAADVWEKSFAAGGWV
jgi:hypothetical protein